jgi:hypothetical protein
MSFGDSEKNATSLPDKIKEKINKTNTDIINTVTAAEDNKRKFMCRIPNAE